MKAGHDDSQHFAKISQSFMVWKRFFNGKIYERDVYLLGKGTLMIYTNIMYCKYQANTVDGRNPAPPGMYKSLEIMG